MSLVVLQGEGPLPLKANFKSPLDGPATFFLSGSAWSGAISSWVGINIDLDGVTIGTASVFCNERASHRALVPIVIPMDLSFGEHIITLMQDPTKPATVTDFNDIFQVTLLY